MADEYLKDQTPFAGTSIQDTDLFWISVDNLDTTFSTYKITGLQLKTLLDQNIYNNNGTIIVPRVVSINDATGSLKFQSTKTAFNFQPAFINWLYNDGISANQRQIILSISSVGIYSKLIEYDAKRAYTDTHITTNATQQVLGTFSAINPTNFTVVAEIKGFCSGTNDTYFIRITQLYRLVAGVATAVGVAETYEPVAPSTFNGILAPNGQDIDVKVTGIAGNIVDWTAVVTIF